MGKTAAIILAGGQGTRMKSKRAKVLHEICGVPMIRFVVEAALRAVENVTVVVGHQAKAVEEALASYPRVQFALQERQLGTGHAVLTALPKISTEVKNIAILCGDTPLLRRKTLEALIHKHEASSKNVTILGTRLDNPYGYGRMICGNEGEVIGIVEESDADEKEAQIKIVNSGTYCIDLNFLKSVLPEVGRENAQQEFYLTDVVTLAYQRGVPAIMVEAEDPMEVLGVNTPEDLALAQEIVTRALAKGCENPLDFCRFR